MQKCIHFFENSQPEGSNVGNLLYLLLFSQSVLSDSLRPHGLHMPDIPILHHLLELAQTHVH